MIHRVKEKKLGRDAAHRKALIKNLSTSLVMHKKIETTLAKAKYLRPFIEKLITKAKQSQDFTAVKYAKNKLTTNDAVNALFKEVVPLFEKRQGGYTRIVKLPERVGDNAKMARIEFVIDKTAKVEPAKKKETTKAKKVKEVKEEVKEEAVEVKE